MEEEFAGSDPAEQAFLSLIRCYTADDTSAVLVLPGIDRALSLVKEMDSLNLEPRLRTYQPILEAVCRTGDLQRALSLLHEMVSERGIHPNTSQMAMLLAFISNRQIRVDVTNPSDRQNKDDDKDKDEQLLAQFFKIMHLVSQEMLGMEHVLLQKLMLAVQSKELKALSYNPPSYSASGGRETSSIFANAEELMRAQGVIVNSRKDIPGRMLIDRLDEKSATSTAGATTDALSVARSVPGNVNVDMNGAGVVEGREEHEGEGYVYVPDCGAGQAVVVSSFFDNPLACPQNGALSFVSSEADGSSSNSSSGGVVIDQWIDEKKGGTGVNGEGKGGANLDYDSNSAPPSFLTTQQRIRVLAQEAWRGIALDNSTEDTPSGSNSQVQMQADGTPPATIPLYLERFLLHEIPLKPYSERKSTALPAALVELSKESSHCPNCGEQVQKLRLTDSEAAAVRAGLEGVARANGETQMKAMSHFEGWLADKVKRDGKHPTYIVDGANVAYHRQNFENGKFSYRQIELVVDAILERVQQEKVLADQQELPFDEPTVLVLLPYPYAQKVVPNSSRHRRGRKIEYMTKEEQAVLTRFEKEDMLYVVPQGGNDDWYWMYATVNEGRPQSTPAYVLTNDLMRDHKGAFSSQSPLTFLRWRAGAVIHFDFSHAVERGVSLPSVSLVSPGSCSREIQVLRGGMGEKEGGSVESTEFPRLHIPGVDRSSWACLSLAPPSLSSSNSDSDAHLQTAVGRVELAALFRDAEKEKERERDSRSSNSVRKERNERREKNERKTQGQGRKR